MGKTVYYLTGMGGRLDTGLGQGPIPPFWGDGRT